MSTTTITVTLPIDDPEIHSGLNWSYEIHEGALMLTGKRPSTAEEVEQIKAHNRATAVVSNRIRLDQEASCRWVTYAAGQWVRVELEEDES